MKNNLIFVFAAVMAASGAARAAGIDFDGARPGTSNASDLADVVSAFHGGPGGHPQPGIPPQPGHPVPLPPLPHPGGPGPVPPVHPFPPQHPDSYIFGGYKDSCRTLQFTAQSPLTVTETMTLEEFGENCVRWGSGDSHHCSPVTTTHRREFTVKLGQRKLESWETERLVLCMKDPETIEANTAGMLYDYAVTAAKDDSMFKHATLLTLTPGAKKPSSPASKDLLMTFAGVTRTGEVSMTLLDTRAEYFKGEKITITVEGASLPQISLALSPEQIQAAVTQISVTRIFDVAPSYEIKLLDAPKAGKYAVKVTFSRNGPLASGTEATTAAAFEIL